MSWLSADLRRISTCLGGSGDGARRRRYASFARGIFFNRRGTGLSP
jgi:hypothetical protein